MQKHIDISKIPADYILISHGHMDHLADAATIAKRTGATIVSNFEITVWFANQGVHKTHGMNHGGSRAFDFGRVKYVSAIHSSNFPDSSYAGNPGGFVVESREGNFYYAGDTALTMDMKLIGETVALRFAALPVVDNFTMGIEDAIKGGGFRSVQRDTGRALRHFSADQYRPGHGPGKVSGRRQAPAADETRRDN